VPKYVSTGVNVRDCARTEPSTRNEEDAVRNADRNYVELKTYVVYEIQADDGGKAYATELFPHGNNSRTQGCQESMGPVEVDEYDSKL
jgi:hypothetical protein